MLTTGQIVLMNFAIFFGQYLIIAAALNFQYGNAGIPNMSNNLSVACGAYVTSSIVIRICMVILGVAGVTFRPDWVFDNPYNVSLITSFLKTRPLLSISLFMLSLALALVFGILLGGLIAIMSGRLRASILMVLLYVLASVGNVFATNISWLAGGTHGAFIPNFLSWYPGENMLVVAVTTLLVGLFCFFIIRTIQNSPFGRLMRAVRENEWTVASMGKDVVRIRREVMMFSSGMMAVTGVLIALYYNYVQYKFYDQLTYTLWPWLMITIGGMGNIAGSLIGVIFGVGILKAISTFNMFYGGAIASTGRASLFLVFENMALSVLLLLFLVFKPFGLIPEKRLYIPKIDYKSLVEESSRPPEDSEIAS